MAKTTNYENFPVSIPVLSGLVAISIYAIGAYTLVGFGIWAPVLYLLYCLWVEIGILSGSCIDCYYYGKLCGLGKGKLCALLFKQGNPQRFAKRPISWSNILPDFLVPIFPVVGGTILLVKDFSWPLLTALILLAILYLGGNAVVRGSFACKYCRQREIGCPAEKLFAGEGTGTN